jgi:hypothetical protein
MYQMCIKFLIYLQNNKKFNIPFDILKMRPTSRDFQFIPDDDLKKKYIKVIFT